MSLEAGVEVFAHPRVAQMGPEKETPTPIPVGPGSTEPDHPCHDTENHLMPWGQNAGFFQQVTGEHSGQRGL